MGNLTDEQIDAAWSFSTGGSFVTEDMRAFARKVAAEAVRQEREAVLAAILDTWRVRGSVDELSARRCWENALRARSEHPSEG